MPAVGTEFLVLATNVTQGSHWLSGTNQGRVYYDTYLDEAGMGVLTFAGFARAAKAVKTIQMIKTCIKYNMHGYVNLVEQCRFLPGCYCGPSTD